MDKLDINKINGEENLGKNEADIKKNPGINRAKKKKT